MSKDYRLSKVEAGSLTAYEIVEKLVWRIHEDFPELSYAAEEKVNSAKEILDPIHIAVHAAWMTAGYAANGGVGHLVDVCSRSYLESAVRGYELLGEAQAARSLRVVLETLDKAASEGIPYDDYCEDHEEEIPYVPFEGDRWVSHFFHHPTVLYDRRDVFVQPETGEQDGAHQPATRTASKAE